jgi:hypothetical protein
MVHSILALCRSRAGDPGRIPTAFVGNGFFWKFLALNVVIGAKESYEKKTYTPKGHSKQFWMTKIQGKAVC